MNLDRGSLTLILLSCFSLFHEYILGLKSLIKTFLLFLVFPRVSLNLPQWKRSIYESEPRLSDIKSFDNRCYSSMKHIPKSNQAHSVLKTNVKSSVLRNSSNNNDNFSQVKSPNLQSESLKYASANGYLNAFLLKKQQQQQQHIHSQKLKPNTSQIERPNIIATDVRPKSAPTIDQTASSLLKSKNIILQQKSTNNRLPLPLQRSSKIYSKSVTFQSENSQNHTLNTNDENINTTLNQARSRRINIGITLDSRLRKTPVLDMLRSTTMQSDLIEPQHLNRMNSLGRSFIPIARF